MSITFEKVSPAAVRVCVDFSHGWHPFGPKTSWFTSWTQGDWVEGMSLRATVKMFQRRGISEAPCLKKVVHYEGGTSILVRSFDKNRQLVSEDRLTCPASVWNCEAYSLIVDLVLLVYGHTKRLNPALHPKRKRDGTTTLFSATNATTSDDREVKAQLKLRLSLRDDREPPVWWDWSPHASAGLPSLGKR
jgi:hypothetical protein